MKMKISNPFKTLSKTELAIWLISSVAIIVSYLLPESTSWPNLIDALIGVTALIFIAKGNVLCAMAVKFGKARLIDNFIVNDLA